VGLPNNPTSTGNGGLVARLSPLALDRIEEGCLLTADVRAGAAPDLDLEAASGACDIAAEQPVNLGELNGVFNSCARERVLAANVQVPLLATCRDGGDSHPLDDCEGIALHQDAVLECAWL